MRDFLLVLVVVVLVALWAVPRGATTPSAESAPTSTPPPTSTPEIATTPIATKTPNVIVERVPTEPTKRLEGPFSINGARLGMTLEEVESFLGPTQAFIPPNGPRPKRMTFGRVPRADGLGWEDHTVADFDDQGRVVHLSGFRLERDGYVLGRDPSDPTTREGVERVFGPGSFEKLREGSPLKLPEQQLVVWKSGRELLYRLGTKLD